MILLNVRGWIHVSPTQADHSSEAGTALRAGWLARRAVWQQPHLWLQCSRQVRGLVQWTHERTGSIQRQFHRSQRSHCWSPVSKLSKFTNFTCALSNIKYPYIFCQDEMHMCYRCPCGVHNSWAEVSAFYASLLPPIELTCKYSVTAISSKPCSTNRRLSSGICFSVIKNVSWTALR